MTNDERTEAIWEVTNCGFRALSEAFEKLDAQANVALSAMAYYIAEAAVQNGVDRDDFLRGCATAFDDAQLREDASRGGMVS